MRTLYQVDFKVKKLINKLEIDQDKPGAIFFFDNEVQYHDLQEIDAELLAVYMDIDADAYLVGA